MRYDSPDRYDPPPAGMEFSAEVRGPKKKARKVAIIAVVIGVLLVIACIGGLFAMQGDPPTKQAPAPATATASKAVKAPAKAATTKPKTAAKVVSIGAGEFEVGKDVTAGKYLTAGAREGIVLLCTYTVSDKGGNPVDFGAISNEEEQAYVTLKNGQTFKSTGCKPWVKQ